MRKSIAILTIVTILTIVLTIQTVSITKLYSMRDVINTNDYSGSAIKDTVAELIEIRDDNEYDGALVMGRCSVDFTSATITLAYGDGKHDVASWAFAWENNLPKSTTAYLHVKISSVAVPENATVVIAGIVGLNSTTAPVDYITYAVVYDDVSKCAKVIRYQGPNYNIETWITLLTNGTADTVYETEASVEDVLQFAVKFEVPEDAYSSQSYKATGNEAYDRVFIESIIFQFGEIIVNETLYGFSDSGFKQVPVLVFVGHYWMQFSPDDIIVSYDAPEYGGEEEGEGGVTYENKGWLIVRVYDKKGRYIVSNITITKGDFEAHYSNVVGIVKCLDKGLYTVKVEVRGLSQTKDAVVYTNKTTHLKFYFDVPEKTHRLQIEANQSDTEIRVYNSQGKLVGKAIGTFDEVVPEDHYYWEVRDSKGKTLYRDSDYVDEDKKYWIPELNPDAVPADYGYNETVGEYWVGVIVYVIDSQGAPVPGCTVYLQETSWYGIGSFASSAGLPTSWTSIGQGTTDTQGVATIVVNDYQVRTGYSHRVYVELATGSYAQGVNLRQNGFTYVVIRASPTNLANSPTQSFYQFMANPMYGGLMQVVISILPLVIVISLINALLGMVKRRR